MNIIGRTNVVTIDRHAYRIALNDNGAGRVRMTANQYKVFEDAYLLAARQIGIESTELQAVTWHWFKRVNDRGNYLESESECPF